MLEPSTLYSILDTVKTVNNETTNIKVNNYIFKIVKNIKLNLCICKMDPPSKVLEEKINIILSNSIDLTIENIIKIILVCSNPFKHSEIVYNEDRYSIFSINSNIKYKHNKSLLYNKFFNSTIIKPNDKIKNDVYKDLLLNDKQFYSLIISEIDKINTNTNYSHYVYCNNDDIMDLSIRFVYNSGELGDKMNNFSNTFGINYFEINMKLSRMYPFVVPIIKYIKPKIDIELVSSIYNMDLWDYKIWNYTITLDYIINKLGDLFEPLFNKYLDVNNTPFNTIELKMIELNSILKINNSNIIPLKIVTCDNNSTVKDSSAWKTGTGYGFGNSKDSWDISKFIDISKTNNDRIISILKEINTQEIKYNKMLYNYIEYKFSSINLLTLNTEIDIYNEIIKTIKLINDDKLINTLGNHIKEIYDELNSIITNDSLVVCIEEKFMIVYLYLIEIINKAAINNKLIEQTKTLSLSADYEKMFKENSFGMFKISNYHSFYDKKNDLITPKTIMRIISEMSSLKKDVPINWDSSVAIRTCSTNANFISFIISGPKDTPYHNGLFEFHAYFPDKYPSVVPNVLIKTTDNGRVRFNPNLYSNGKVCLSLLGTWNGEKGESWIPELSTFFQVIISIQSLILVDEPYFNEPGYERSMNTSNGKKHSFDYNDNIRLETIKVAMIKMLENPPESYETLIMNHFKFKKDEIISIVDKWCDESNKKEEFNNSIIKLKELLNKL